MIRNVKGKTDISLDLPGCHRWFKGDEKAWLKHFNAAQALDPHDELLLDYLSGAKAFLDVP
jgi:hypothetical protein